MTEQRDEWGPWVEHDGKGCPCIGQWVEVWSSPCGCTHVQQLWAEDAAEWWQGGRGPCRCMVCGTRGIFARVEHYRIRKPRGLAILESCLTDLPAPQREGEPA